MDKWSHLLLGLSELVFQLRNAGQRSPQIAGCCCHVGQIAAGRCFLKESQTGLGGRGQSSHERKANTGDKDHRTMREDRATRARNIELMQRDQPKPLQTAPVIEQQKVWAAAKETEATRALEESAATESAGSVPERTPASADSNSHCNQRAPKGCSSSKTPLLARAAPPTISRSALRPDHSRPRHPGRAARVRPQTCRPSTRSHPHQVGNTNLAIQPCLTFVVPLTASADLGLTIYCVRVPLSIRTNVFILSHCRWVAGRVQTQG